jgi:hypothetical protein
MITETIICPRLLVISGSGKKVGKTKLAVSIIRSMKNDFEMTAIKISRHFHKAENVRILYEEGGSYSIYEEKSVQPVNDSSKMKYAGAARAFYIQAFDSRVGEAFLKCLEYIDEYSPIICESGSLGNLIRPGLAIYITNECRTISGEPNGLNMILIVRGQGEVENVLDSITFKSGRWLNQKTHS